MMQRKEYFSKERKLFEDKMLKSAHFIILCALKS